MLSVRLHVHVYVIDFNVEKNNNHHWRLYRIYFPKHNEAFSLCWFNIGPTSQTLAQYWNNIGETRLAFAEFLLLVKSLCICLSVHPSVYFCVRYSAGPDNIGSQKKHGLLGQRNLRFYSFPGIGACAEWQMAARDPWALSVRLSAARRVTHRPVIKSEQPSRCKRCVYIASFESNPGKYYEIN